MCGCRIKTVFDAATRPGNRRAQRFIIEWNFEKLVTLSVVVMFVCSMQFFRKNFCIIFNKIALKLYRLHIVNIEVICMFIFDDFFCVFMEIFQ